MSSVPPKQAYATHKSSAAARGVPFELSFEQWWAIWEENYGRRGVASDQLGMCRTRDEGGYSIGNVRLDTPKGNAADRVLANKVRKAPAAFRFGEGRHLTAKEGLAWCTRDVFAPYTEEEEDY